MGLQEQWQAAVIGGIHTPTVPNMTDVLAQAEASPEDNAQGFREKVCMAAAAAAVAIANEDPMTTKNHAARAAFARQFLNEPFALMGPLALAVASQGIDFNSSDQEISNAVASIWNAIAGA